MPDITFTLTTQALNRIQIARDNYNAANSTTLTTKQFVIRIIREGVWPWLESTVAAVVLADQQAVLNAIDAAYDAAKTELGQIS